MNVIITGASSGIGKAIAEMYLADGLLVIGIGRSHTISHSNYQAIVCDLSDEKKVHQLAVDSWISEQVLLINNAGILGNVQRLSDQVSPDISTVFAVNTVAPALLMNKLAQACGEESHLTVVNISSGAAKRAIPSWSAYCASKAALEMLSETFYLEEREKGRNTIVYSVAPGIVDTPMQTNIRSVPSSDFSRVEQFQQYHADGELVSPAIVAQKLKQLLNIPYSGVVSCSLRDLK